MLVADSSSTSRTILREMLEGWGGIVDEAENIASAFAKIQDAVQAKKPYKIIVSDMDLPAMGRKSITSGIAENPLASSALVIMLGGVKKQLKPAREEILANSFLYKPVTPSDLLSAIMQALSTDAGLPDSTAGKINQQISAFPKKILLVEDTLLNQQMAKYMLEGWGHEVIIAENGQEGFETYISEELDMILMDVQMPLMDGLEATGHIRSYEGKKGLPHIPILAMTAHALKGDAETCLSSGMDGYISKPINWKGLFAKIEQYSSSGSRDHPARVETPLHDDKFDTFDDNSESADLIPTIDSLVPKFNNDEAFLFDMIKLLLAELPVRMNKIREAVIDRDASKIELDTHALKSMLGHFGKNKLYYLAMKLEKTAGEKKLEGMEEMLSRLEQDLKIFEEHLNNLQS